MRIAVITGASAGIGREFVFAVDRKYSFDEIWVVARRAERLEALRGEVRAPLRCLALDLTAEESLESLKDLLAEAKPEISCLVNASGFGVFQAFADAPLETQLRMIDLNDKTLVAVTYLALPYMGRGGRIVNMGSLSSFQPVPYINVYGDLRRGRDVSVCGLSVRAQVLLVKLLPHRLVMRIWCRQQGKPV